MTDERFQPIGPVTVPVKSAWQSKINWTQGVSTVAMILAFISGGKLNFTPEQQAAIVVVIGVFFDIATWVARTWFTKSVTKSSV